MSTVVAHRIPSAYVAFRDRRDAGAALAAFLGPQPDTVQRLVLALPRGGVPVGVELALTLGARLEPLVARKLPIPFSPEAGFGAVALDGTVVLNERMVFSLGLSGETIRSVISQVQEEVRRRARVYTGSDRPPDVEGKRVYLVDDGLASGYTMIAGARMVRAGKPAALVLAVPVASAESLARVQPEFDEAYCLLEQQRTPFAVASFYTDFHEMTDGEVLDLLRQAAPGRSRDE